MNKNDEKIRIIISSKKPDSDFGYIIDALNIIDNAIGGEIQERFDAMMRNPLQAIDDMICDLKPKEKEKSK